MSIPRKDDRYPSRTGGKAQFAQRLDPVVYADEQAQAPINKALIDQYEKDGFLVLPALFSNGEVDAMRAELDSLRSDRELVKREEVIAEPGDGAVRSIFSIHTLSPVFNQLAMDPRLLNLASYLLGDDVYIHQSRLNYKPGFRGKEFYWHSDFETWHVEDGMPAMRALSMSITLTDNRETNGALMLIPGSHRDYVVCEGYTPEAHYRQSLRKQEYGVPSDESLEVLVQQNGIVSATGSADSVVIFDCNIMHGSNGNITPYPRSNAFFVYNACSNRLEAPYSGQAPRPEYIATRRPLPLEPSNLPKAS